MGSTGEHVRKRRHFSSVAPTGASAATAAEKKQPPSVISEEKKLDVVILKYKNQRLYEQLEAKKVGCDALRNKLSTLQEKHKGYGDRLILVNNSWEKLVRELESVTAGPSGSPNHRYSQQHDHVLHEKGFLSRLLESGSAECSGDLSTSLMNNDAHQTLSSTHNVLKNAFSSLSDVLHTHKSLSHDLTRTLPESESRKLLQDTANNFSAELSDVLQTLDDLHLKHRQLVSKVQSCRDLNARSKAEKKRLKEELATTVSELKETNHNLASLKAQRDNNSMTPVLLPSSRSKTAARDVSDKTKEMGDLEAAYKDLMDTVSNRLTQIKGLHEERIEILRKLATVQNALSNLQAISSSTAFQTLKSQLQQSQEEIEKCWRLLEKLQIERDSFIWHEKEVMIKSDLCDLSKRVSADFELKIMELEKQLQKICEEKQLLDRTLEVASRKLGRKEVLSQFQGLLSSLPKRMGVIQGELTECRHAASELHILRAEVQSFSRVFQQEELDVKSLSSRSGSAASELRRLQERIQDLRLTIGDLELFLDMFKRESIGSRQVIDAIDREYRAWAVVQSLKSSLDERKLESSVKAAISAEALSQQRLATAEARIPELRHKLEASKKEIEILSEKLKSKNEECDAYSSEIESIGQAYEDMQTQNQQLLQQIAERDDHNIKLVTKSVEAKQEHDSLCWDVQYLSKQLQHATALTDLHLQKSLRLEDQLKIFCDQVGKLAEEGWQHTASLESAQRKLADAQGESHTLHCSLDGTLEKVATSRVEISALLIELEKERFQKRRLEDDVEDMVRKATQLKARRDQSGALQKLRQEADEYRGILKCSVCHDRQKEVVITKCYHLFCNKCVQKSLGNRQRRCPTCSTCFGPNDVKPIYI